MFLDGGSVVNVGIECTASLSSSNTSMDVNVRFFKLSIISCAIVWLTLSDWRKTSTVTGCDQTF